MITQSFDLNLIPESSPVVVHCDQYDKGTGRLVISLYDENIAYSPSGTAKIQGVKPDGKGFEYDASISGNVVTANLTEQMSAVAGRVRCQIVVTETTGRTGTFVFILDVQPSALPLDTDLSESDYQFIEQVIEAAEDAQEYSEDAEAWAVGERGGVPVGPSDPTYENNAEYWSQIAAQYAQGGWHYMGSIPFSQLPTSGMVGGDMYNITDDFVTDSRFIEGAGHQCYAGQNVSWVASVSKWDLPLVPRIVPDMTSSTKGIGKPDGKTTEVSSGVFNAIGVSIPAEVNSGATQYASNWLYYEDTTEVITPSTKQNYRATYNGQTKLYYWTGSEYVELAGGGGGGDYMGLYGMTEIQSSDGQGTTLLDLDQYTSVGNYFCNGKAKIATPHYAEIGLNTTSTGTHSNAKFILYVRKINDAWILQDLYLVHATGVKRLIHYQRHAEYANNTWTFGIWRADVDTGSVSPDLSPYSLGNGMNNVLVNNIVDGDVLTRVNGKWSNKPKSLYPSAPTISWAEYQTLVDNDEDDPDTEYYIDDIDVAETYYVETSGQTAITGATSLTFTNSHIKPTADIRILAEPASCKVATNPQYKVSAKLSSVGNGTATITFPALAENTDFWLLIECPLAIVPEPSWDYNTDEVVIGTWLGQTAYRKVVPFTISETWQTITHNIGVSQYITCRGIALKPDSPNLNDRQIPYCAGGTWYSNIIGIAPNSVIFEAGADFKSYYNGCSAYAILEYIK